MGVLSLLRVFWAMKNLIIAAALSCMMGAVLMSFFLPPRYESSARVILDVIKPDPVTGEVLGLNATQYVNTQVALITDYAVTGLVSDRLHLTSDPGLIAQFNKRAKGDTRDFRQFVSDFIRQNTRVKPVVGTNILDISYSANSPEFAKRMADALRDAFIDTTLNMKHESADKTYNWYLVQVEKSKRELDDAVLARSSFEKANGLVMTSEKMDVDSQRLQSLASQGGISTAFIPPTQSGVSPSTVQLTQIDAEIEAQSKDLGPNNPVIQNLKAKRAKIAQLVEQEKKQAHDSLQATAATYENNIRSINEAVAKQKEKVVAQSDKLGELSRLESEVELRKEEFDKASEKANTYRQQSVGESPISPLGFAIAPTKPVFPNRPLLAVAGLVIGGAFGSGLALLFELLARRVRSAEDLLNSLDVPVLGVIPAPSKARRRNTRLIELSAHSTGSQPTAVHA
jgi:uncharacterized protein involved in exopolysaccharide biosynthesis